MPRAMRAPICLEPCLPCHRRPQGQDQRQAVATMMARRMGQRPGVMALRASTLHRPPPYPGPLLSLASSGKSSKPPSRKLQTLRAPCPRLLQDLRARRRRRCTRRASGALPCSRRSLPLCRLSGTQHRPAALSTRSRERLQSLRSSMPTVRQTRMQKRQQRCWRLRRQRHASVKRCSRHRLPTLRSVPKRPMRPSSSPSRRLSSRSSVCRPSCCSCRRSRAT
mmetsp:Transcript_51025/g.132515  ORF Transcript_51025/g.132515 Transcript_51025/m.132515 type:complete len:222 (+) Transcript_51025:300-965(+)